MRRAIFPIWGSVLRPGPVLVLALARGVPLHWVGPSRAWATRVMVCSGMAAPRPADCEKRDSCFPEQNSPGTST